MVVAKWHGSGDGAARQWSELEDSSRLQTSECRRNGFHQSENRARISPRELRIEAAPVGLTGTRRSRACRASVRGPHVDRLPTSASPPTTPSSPREPHRKKSPLPVTGRVYPFSFTLITTAAVGLFI